MMLRSPLTGRALRVDTPHSLSAGDERWPVIDGIAYLRAGSHGRAREAVAALDKGDRNAALVILLAEQDPWWDGPLPDAATLKALVIEADRLSLREAMTALQFGRVGDYFAHRWSDPTFVAGLALMDACWPAPKTAFELACGIGHYLRGLQRVGVAATGADIVFSKLWLARHWVVDARTRLICMDASAPFPLMNRFDLALCHDAFYFFQDKAHVAQSLLALAPALLMAHIHNRDAANFSSAAATSEAELRTLFPDAELFGDEELTAAAIDDRIPAALGETTEAFAVATPPVRRRSAFGPLAQVAIGTMLRRNPLLTANGIAWPSERYAREYGPRATYRTGLDLPEAAAMAPNLASHLARRELLDLPERW